MLPKAQAPPVPPCAFDPASYSSPGLQPPAATRASRGQRDSTPRLFLVRGAAAPAPAVPAPLPGPAVVPLEPLAAATLPPTQPPGTACSGAGGQARPLQGRPSVPRLNLNGACGAAVAPPAIASGKRSRLARQGTLPAESSASGGGGTSAGTGSQPPRGGLRIHLPVPAEMDEAAEGGTPVTKRSRAVHSPPHMVFNCGLFSPGAQQYSAEKAKVGGVGRKWVEQRGQGREGNVPGGGAPHHMLCAPVCTATSDLLLFSSLPPSCPGPRARLPLRLWLRKQTPPVPVALPGLWQACRLLWAGLPPSQRRLGADSGRSVLPPRLLRPRAGR